MTRGTTRLDALMSGFLDAGNLGPIVIAAVDGGQRRSAAGRDL
jgi:hypothetical protein